ncbi:hypothetical protein ASG93_29465 [Paenibacillus sp. Soil787]|nr:hypothetical protein ASG93_29465 [Paenibacillus sp. Soil787]
MIAGRCELKLYQVVRGILPPIAHTLVMKFITTARKSELIGYHWDGKKAAHIASSFLQFNFSS